MPAEKVNAEKRPHTPFVVFLGDLQARDKSLVGGKAASLAELTTITSVPPAFMVTTAGYDVFLEHNPHLNGLIGRVDELSRQWIDCQRKKSSAEDVEVEIREVGDTVRQAVMNAELPKTLIKEIQVGYQHMCEGSGVSDIPVAVRSSGVAEDLPGASFAGQYDTLLNQKGIEQVTESILNCFASNFTARVITYRNEHALHQMDRDSAEFFSHRNSRMAIAIQQMVDAKAAGVAFSLDPTSGAPITKIEVTHGLGEALASGKATPDSFAVDPNTRVIIGRTRGEKLVKTIRNEDSGGVETIETSDAERRIFTLPDDQVKEIAENVKDIAGTYGRPMDTEFVVDQDDRLWFVQARPETIYASRNPMIIPMKTREIDPSRRNTAVKLCTGGKTGSPGVAAGRVTVAENVAEALDKIRQINQGDSHILVAHRTDPDWVEAMKKVGGIITEHGGPNCHAAIISREQGTPCLVGAGGEMYNKLAGWDGREITLDAGSETVYEGLLPLVEFGEDIDVQEILNHPTRTKLGLILANPETAAKMYALRELGDNFAISLLRIEFILSSHIGIHARALEDFDNGKVEDLGIRRQISEKIAGFASGRDYYITKLAEGIASFAAIYPDSEITVRTTDFKTNEYSQLIGGSLYEKKEENPMMGWRGLIRSLAPENHEVTRWELEAIRRAREMGYKNIKLMFPVVRHPVELTGGSDLDKLGFKGIFQLMDEVGLLRGEDGFEAGIMVEIPANSILIDEFAKTGIDFISFGTNDLTQSTLLSDRDSGILAQFPWLRETHPAIVRQVQQVIRTCKQMGIKTGICGNAPSNNPEFAKMLVKEGIDSIGVLPDKLLSTYKLVQEAEQS